MNDAATQATPRPTVSAYLGDGVNIELGYGDVVLSTERVSDPAPGRHWLSLGPSELMSLCRFVARVDPMLALQMSAELVSAATPTIEAESAATLEEIGAALKQIARRK